MEVGYSRIKAGFSMLRIDGSVCHRSGNPRELLHELPEAKQQTQPQISAVMPLCGLREGTGRLFASRQATSDDDLEIKARQQAIVWFTAGGQGVICHPRSILSASLCIICFLAKHVSSYYQRQKDSRAGTNSSENCS
jgi:hypothetical protein